MVDRCAGCPYATAAVGPRGPEDAEVCIVGEAPGTEELKSGVPFIGPSGKLLSKVLERAGLDIGAVYITNALRCRPPIGTPPPREALEACRGRLVEEVTRHPRKLVIALGNSALRSLSRNYNSKITQERGKLRSYGTVYEDRNFINNAVISVLPAYHPALILRAPGEFKKLQDDILYAGELVGGADRRTPGDIEYEVARAEGIGEWLDFLSTQPVLALDIETSGFNPRQDSILCLSVSYTANKAVVFPGPLLEKYPKRFGRFFSSPTVFVWHNGKFDTSFLRQAGFPARVDEDTMLMHFALSEGVREEHGLKPLAADLLGAEPNYDAEVKRYLKRKSDSYSVVPKQVLYKYCARDTDHTFQLYQLFVQDLNKQPSLNYAYEHVMLPASNFLQEVEKYGVYVNRNALTELRKELQAELAEQLRILQEESGNKFLNPNSPQQMKEALQTYGYNVHSTRAEVIKDLDESELTVALSAYRKASKMLGTYVEGVHERIENDGRVHSTYLIHGTATGRLSSRNPNMQNVPRDSHVRNIFQAPPDKALVELDYSQAELRVLAYLSNDPGLRQVYETGRDLHDEVSKQLFPGWEEYKDTPRGREQRVRAKFVNFGIAYGRGAESIVAEFKIPMATARLMIQRWWRAYPEAHRYIFTARRAIRQGALESPFGRRRRFALIPDNKHSVNALENEAANFVIQSTASDLTLLSAMHMHDELVQRWDAHIINLVHDSILIECQPAEAEEVGAYAQGVMEATPWDELQWSFPFTADYKIANRWGDLK
jgi:DNA polymerase-1